MYQSRAAGHPARRTTVFALLGFVIAVALVPLPAGAAAARQSDLSGVTLRVGVAQVRDSSTQDVRLASGVFDNTPYEIKWATFPASSAALEALNAGAIDVTVDQPAPNTIYAQAGAKEAWTRATAPFKIVAASLPPPAAGPVIAVHPDAGIRKVADLEGMKVAYAKGTTSHLYWLLSAREAKLKPGDVQAVELPVAEARAAFLSGAVDALVSVNRTVQPMVREGQAAALARSNGVVPEYRVTTARTAFLQDRKQAAAVGDFVERLDRSKRWLTKHKSEAAAIYERVANVDPVDAKAAVNELPIETVRVDDSLSAALQDQARLFYTEGATPANPKVAIILDDRYNERVPKAT